MSSIVRLLLASIAAFAVVMAISSPAAAADFRAGDEVVIGADETISEDVYLAAGTMTVDGTIDGDLTVAGGIVQVRGNVTGSVNVAGGDVDIGGNVGGAIRVMGGNVTVSAQVGRDVVVAGGNVTIGPGASVGADVAGGVGRLVIAGTVDGDVLAGAGDLIISGSVGGNVESEVGQLRIDSGAEVAGDVRYGSEREAQIADGAQIGGTVQRTDPQFVADRPLLGENILTAFLGALLALLLLGWGLMLLRPSAVVGPGALLVARPLPAVGAGLAMWIVQFVILIVLTVAAALLAQLAASLGGAFIAPIVLVVMAIVAAVLLAQVWVAMAIGSLIAGRTSPLSPWLAYALGALIWVLLLTVLGYLLAALGGILFLIAWFLGLGAVTLYVFETRRRDVYGRRPADVAAPPA